MAEPISHPADADRRRIGLAIALIVLAALAAYANTFRTPFYLDDIASILDNPTIRHLHPLGPVLNPPAGHGETVGGRPLLNLSLALNYAVSGTHVWSYHAANLLIHVLAGLTLFGLVRRTCRLPRLHDRFGALATPVALAVALWWTLHPLQTEAVTYVVQRAESLMGLCYLVTIYAFLRAIERPPADRAGQEATPSRGWLGLSVVMCLLGMMTKEVTASVPVTVFLFDRTFVSGGFGAAWRARRPYYLALAATWIVQAMLVVSTGGDRGGTVGLGVGVPWLGYWLTQPRAIYTYLSLTAWPHPQVFFYATRWVESMTDVLPYAAVVVPLGVGTVWALWRRPALGFLGWWFFAILAPTSLMPGVAQLIVEHRVYLALAAVLTAAIAAGMRLLGRAALPVAIVAAVAAGVLTFDRNRVYRSELSLWQDTVAAEPPSARDKYNFANALLQADRVPEAIRNYEAALALEPHLPEVHVNLGNALQRADRPAEALEHYAAALKVSPRNAKAHYNWGNALVKLNRTLAAGQQYQLALQLDPTYPEAHLSLADVLAETGRLKEAEVHYAEAARLRPDFAAAQFNWGNALWHAGRAGDALPHYDAAIKLAPDFADAHINRGIALSALQRLEEALHEFGTAARLQPQNAAARYNLANTFAQLGRLNGAIPAYEQALRLQPDLAEAHNNLGDVLLRLHRTPEALTHFEAAIRVKPNYADAHFSRATALVELGKTDAAREEIEATLRLQPDYPGARDLLRALDTTKPRSKSSP
jgi:protein O-mannosyl-transferase